MTVDEPFTPAEALAVRIVDRLPADIRTQLLDLIDQGDV